MFERDKMIADYNAARDELLQLIGSLSPQELDKPTVCEPWTVRDLIAHMATSASNVQLLMNRHDQPNPGIEVLNQRNAEGVDARKGRSVQELVAEIKSWHEKNVEYLLGLSDDDLAVEGVLVTGQVIPRAQRFVNAGLHYGEHSAQIRSATGR